MESQLLETVGSGKDVKEEGDSCEETEEGRTGDTIKAETEEVQGSKQGSSQGTRRMEGSSEMTRE